MLCTHSVYIYHYSKTLCTHTLYIYQCSSQVWFVWKCVKCDLCGNVWSVICVEMCKVWFVGNVWSVICVEMCKVWFVWKCVSMICVEMCEVWFVLKCVKFDLCGNVWSVICVEMCEVWFAWKCVKCDSCWNVSSMICVYIVSPNRVQGNCDYLPIGWLHLWVWVPIWLNPVWICECRGGMNAFLPLIRQLNTVWVQDRCEYLPTTDWMTEACVSTV